MKWYYAPEMVFVFVFLFFTPLPPQWGGLDLDSRSSGCARLGGGVGPPLGVVFLFLFLCLCEHYTTYLAMDTSDITLRLLKPHLSQAIIVPLSHVLARSHYRKIMPLSHVLARDGLGCGACDMKASAAIVEPRLLRG